MKLGSISFSTGKKGAFWKSLKGPAAILPMHAEKWYLIQKKQDDWTKVLNNIDAFVADGVGLTWGYKILTRKNIQKISGIDLIDQLIVEAPDTPTYIWGASRENVNKAAENYKKRGLNLVGFHDGFSGTDAEIFKEIKDSGARVVFVGMSAKRAAELVVRLSDELKVTAMTAGGSFDVAAGNYKRAPKLICALGLEWLWRVLLDYKRIKRLPRLVGFVYYVIKEKVGL